MPACTCRATVCATGLTSAQATPPFSHSDRDVSSFPPRICWNCFLWSSPVFLGENHVFPVKYPVEKTPVFSSSSEEAFYPIPTKFLCRNTHAPPAPFWRGPDPHPGQPLLASFSPALATRISSPEPFFLQIFSVAIAAILEFSLV